MSPTTRFFVPPRSVVPHVPPSPLYVLCQSAPAEHNCRPQTNPLTVSCGTPTQRPSLLIGPGISHMGRSLCEGISILQNRLSREGVEYEVANGARIPNLGERRCKMMTVGSKICKRIVLQVADVHKPLLSIGGCADMGLDCHLDDKGGHLTDNETGEKNLLERKEIPLHHESMDTTRSRVSVSQPFFWPT